MSSVVGALRAEALKLRHTFFYWTHAALPLLAAGGMLAYFAGTNGRELWQITAYVELLGIALPIVVSLVCGMAVEVETDNHFQVFLGGRAHKGTAYLYKSLWLMLCGFGALVLAMVLFGVCYDDLLDKNGLGLWGYCKGAILLWLGAAPLYLEHLLLQFQWPKTVSVAVGVAEFVLSALFLTGLGDGLWPLVPCSWSARLVDTYAVALLMPNLEFPPLPWFMVLPLLVLFGIISVWLYRYEGRACHD